MKKIILGAFVFIWTCAAFSQSNYEKGYYLDSQGNKTEGYFKLIDFESINNASFKLDFKKELNQENTKLTTESITEFGIGTDIKYQKMAIQIDDVNLHKDYDGLKDFNLTTASLFLNVLVEGNANLYAYPSENGTKYFYKINNKDNSVNQLLYKKYLNTEGTEVENAYFREQLFNNVKCENQTFNDFLNIKYDKKELIPLFENFNKCQDSPYEVYENKFRKDAKINFTAVGGIHLGTFNMKDVWYPTEAVSKALVALGAEAELVLPSEKWSFFTKLQYGGNMKAQNESYQLDVHFIDLVLGSRWYHAFKNNSKFFLGGAVGLDFPWGIIRTNTSKYNDDLGTNSYFNFAVGYVFNNHYGLDFDLDTNKNILPNFFDGPTTKFNRMGLNFRYTF